jgi:hypothetical protein
MSKEIVIAGYNRDLSWLSKLSDIKKTIYRKGTKKDDIEIFIEANVGENACSFITYLIDMIIYLI